MRVAVLGWAVAFFCTAWFWPAAVQASQQPRPSIAADGAGLPLDAVQLARWVTDTGDHHGLPFGIVDKRSATIRLYTADGILVGSSAVLLGRTLGDHSVAGVGERTQQAALRVQDMTTAAGRFVSEPGLNISGEAIVWIDYGSALAIHRLRTGPSRHRRAERLASDDARGRRVSAGCVVVPEAFYDAFVAPVLGRSRGVVYVMPESGTINPRAGSRVALSGLRD